MVKSTRDVQWLLIIREIQIETTLKYYTPITMAEITVRKWRSWIIHILLVGM